MGIIGLVILINHSVASFPEKYIWPMCVNELIFFASCLGVYGTFVSEFKEFRMKIDGVKVGEGRERLEEERGMKPFV